MVAWGRRLSISESNGKGPTKMPCVDAFRFDNMRGKLRMSG